MREGAILMRLFGSGPMKFPPPLLRSPVPPFRGGLIDNLCSKKNCGGGGGVGGGLEGMRMS